MFWTLSRGCKKFSLVGVEGGGRGEGREREGKGSGEGGGGDGRAALKFLLRMLNKILSMSLLPHHLP